MDTVRLWLSDQLSWFRLQTLTITFTDILEILILAFLVYRLLLWIQNTRAWSLLKGIAIIAACIAVIYLLNMTTLMFLINRVADIAILGAVVIFQPELRRALERLGERPTLEALFTLGGDTPVSERFSDKTVNEIVKGAQEMSREKTGALIVIEQNTRLEEYERTGITLDSVVSSQLLINIFEHNTPLHDGAVIIKGNRITAATCYLPLSDNMMLNKALGTRHRAALGISEETDSLTVVVSEETGAISIAYNGELTHDITPDQLKEQLVILQNKKTAARKFRFWKGRKKHET